MKKNNIHVDFEELLEWISDSEKGNEYEQCLIKDLPHLTLIYENDLLNSSSHQNTADKVFNFLNIPSEKVTTNLVKLMPLNPIDRVENYEELVKFINNTIAFLVLMRYNSSNEQTSCEYLVE